MYAHGPCLYNASVWWIMYELSGSVFPWQMLSSVTHPALEAPPHTTPQHIYTHPVPRSHKGMVGTVGSLLLRTSARSLWILSWLLYSTVTRIHAWYKSSEDRNKGFIKWILFTQSRGENEGEMPSRCQPASPFKSAIVELIRAPEIKMRGFWK